MSFSSFEAADEFGGLAHLVPPGQDPALLPRVHDALTAELNSRNFIERMWVRDKAIHTSRAEFVRTAYCAAQRIVQEEAIASEAAQDPVDDTSSASERTERAVGKAFIANLPLFQALNLLEIEVLRERDRVLAQYDTRTGIIRDLMDAEALIAALEASQVDGG